MEIVLRRYGNSTVAVFPPTVLKDLGLSAGQSMIMNTTEDGKIVLARKRKYILADLLAQCDPKVPPPADMGLWDAAKPAGDVVNVPLDPAVGHEQKGTRPALVLTTKEFNQLGDVLVAPVTQGGDFSRYAGFAVSLTGTGCKTQGVALINKIRMLDLTERQARKIERVPQEVLDDALGRLVALLDC